MSRSDEANRSPVECGPGPRLWPAYWILAAQAVALVLTVTPEIRNVVRFAFMMGGPAVCVLLFMVWLLFASRIPRTERVAILVGTISSSVLFGLLLIDDSMRVLLWIYGAPLAMLVTTALLFFGRRWRPGARATGVLVFLCLGWAAFTAARVEGFDGAYWPELRWRWEPTDEELLLARGVPKSGAVSATLELTGGDWPAFRGPGRDSRVRNVSIDTDWRSSPPRQLWKTAVGPGWSSFAFVSGRLFTQEQRGSDEIVVCYDAATGDEVWRDSYATRFSEIVSGAGPRSTPSFSDGLLYSMGAKAVLSCNDAATGETVWRRDLVEEIGARVPIWGFSSSPLVTEGRVIVYADGTQGRGLVAYDARTGVLDWSAPVSGMNYASAQPVSVGDTKQIVFGVEAGFVSVDPRTGRQFWRHEPTGWKGVSMVQPQQIGPKSLVVPLGDGIGVARLEIEAEGEGWTVAESWTSRFLKPSFNDFVYHDGFLYGFDQSIFTCVDAQTGERRWKRGRYGFGQVLLVEASDSLIVACETGDVVLLAADPREHRELARIEGVTGKTWNHPILAGDRLFVRNGKQAACFKLALTRSAAKGK